jgi:hypothetical protein
MATVDEPGEQELLRAMYEADTTADLLKVMCRELVRLRAELAKLREGLANEVHTRRIVVADEHELRVLIEPSVVEVGLADGSGHAHLAYSEHEGAEVSAVDWRGGVHVLLVADSRHGFEERPKAFVSVNGVELPVPVAATS